MASNWLKMLAGLAVILPLGALFLVSFVAAIRGAWAERGRPIQRFREPAPVTKLPRAEHYGISANDMPAIRAEEQRCKQSLERITMIFFAAVYIVLYAFFSVALWDTFRFWAFIVSLLPPAFLTMFIVAFALPDEGYIHRRVMPEATRIRIEALHSYELALAQYEKWRVRLQVDHWLSLSGIAFEREVRDLFVRSGIAARLTPPSNDGGIDLILPDGAVVQCKSGISRVRPSVVRDLYGAMVACGAPRGILIATGGFSPGVCEFAYDKPIELWDIDRLVEMQANLGICNAT
jgi:hypothetical protein